MKIYDYRINQATMNELVECIDNLSQSESEKVLDATHIIKKCSKENFKENCASFVDNVILPLVKSYAEKTFSILEINAMEEEQFVITLKNENGFDIDDDCTLMKYLLALSAHIEINIIENFAILTLVFRLN